MTNNKVSKVFFNCKFCDETIILDGNYTNPILDRLIRHECPECHAVYYEWNNKLFIPITNDFFLKHFVSDDFKDMENKKIEPEEDDNEDFGYFIESLDIPEEKVPYLKPFTRLCIPGQIQIIPGPEDITQESYSLVLEDSYVGHIILSNLTNKNPYQIITKSSIINQFNIERTSIPLINFGSSTIGKLKIENLHIEEDEGNTWSLEFNDMTMSEVTLNNIYVGKSLNILVRNSRFYSNFNIMNSQLGNIVFEECNLYDDSSLKIQQTSIKDTLYLKECLFENNIHLSKLTEQGHQIIFEGNEFVKQVHIDRIANAERLYILQSIFNDDFIINDSFFSNGEIIRSKFNSEVDWSSVDFSNDPLFWDEEFNKTPLLPSEDFGRFLTPYNDEQTANKYEVISDNEAKDRIIDGEILTYKKIKNLYLKDFLTLDTLELYHCFIENLYITPRMEYSCGVKLNYCIINNLSVDLELTSVPTTNTTFISEFNMSFCKINQDDSNINNKAIFQNAYFMSNCEFEWTSFLTDIFFPVCKFAEYTSFNYAVFKGNIIFSECKFHHLFRARHCMFKKGLQIEICRFFDEISFNFSNFEKDVLLEDCSFEQIFFSLNCFFYEDLSITRCKFNEQLGIRNSRFSNLDIFNTDIQEEFFLENCFIRNNLVIQGKGVGGAANFDRLECKNKLEISNWRIGNDFNIPFSKLNTLRFHGIQVKRDTDFSQSRIDGHIIWTSSVFGSIIGFHQSLLYENVTIRHCRIGHQLQFSKSLFHNDLVLENIEITDGLFLDNSIAKKNIILDNCTIKSLYARLLNCNGNITLNTLFIKSDLYFTQAVFHSNVDISDVTVNKNAYFYNAKFLSDVFYRDLKIENTAYYMEVEHNKVVLFDMCNINNSFFIGTTFKEDVEFENVIFSGYCFFAFDEGFISKALERGGEIDQYLSYTKFNKRVDFTNSSFKGTAIFDRCLFNNVATFYNTQFYAETHFDFAIFKNIANFTTCFCDTEITFNNAIFENALILDDSIINYRANFINSEFVDGKSSISFDNAVIGFFNIKRHQIEEEDKKMELNKWDFMIVPFIFKFLRYVLGFAKRSKIYHEGILLGHRKINKHIFKRRIAKKEFNSDVEEIMSSKEIESPLKQLLEQKRRRIKKENCSDKTDFKKDKIYLCKNLIDNYLILKNSYRRRGLHADEDWAYYNLMKYKSRLEIFENNKRNGFFKLNNIYTLFKILIFEKIFGWGVKVSHIFLSSIFVILLMTFTFPFLHGEWKNSLFVETKLSSDMGIFHSFWFSIQNFIGFFMGSYAPKSSGDLLIASSIETFVGSILLLFMIFLYIRKLMR